MGDVPMWFWPLGIGAILGVVSDRFFWLGYTLFLSLLVGCILHG